MSKTIHFVSGLPRAGSTLLMNLLAQNEKVHSTATSGLHEIGYIARQFHSTEEFKTIPNPRDGETLFYDYVQGGCERTETETEERAAEPSERERDARVTALPRYSTLEHIG